MRRRLNYTGRKRISKKDVVITLNKEDENLRSFNAKINLFGKKLPSKSKVYIETYHKTDVKRFDFGKVGKIKNNVDIDLSDIPQGYNIQFRMLVVDETEQEGLILAHANRIRLKSEDNKKPLLPVDFRDLGQQVWNIRYEEDYDGPVLILNDKIPNCKNLYRDPQFIISVLPAVLKEILLRIFFIDKTESTSDISVEWHNDWIEFAKSVIPGEEIPEVEENINRDKREEIESWINKAVAEFCQARKEWKYYIREKEIGRGS